MDFQNNNKTDKQDNINGDSGYNERLEKKMAEGLKREEKSIVGFFIKNYRFTYLIILAIFALGIYSLLTLPREANPEVKFPFAVVYTIYPGASPTDVEDLITKKIEEKIKNLENLNIFTSTSGQGISSIFVEFEAEADLKESYRKLRQAVDEVKPTLPAEANDTEVIEIRANDIPIVTYSLAGNYNKKELKKFADILQDELEGIKDVSKVPIIGGIEREFQVIVSQIKLANYNLSLGQIVGAVARNNLDLPSGSIEIDDFRYNVNVKGKFIDSSDLNNIVIATYEESPVFLGDIATIIDGYKEKSTDSRLGFKGEESKNTVSLQLYKKQGGNILRIVEASQNKIKEVYDKKLLPEDLKIQKTNDNSVFIKEDLSRLGKSGIQTVILISLILLLILNLRGAIITALSVPIAFLMSFIFLKAQGMTLNGIVLFSLVLSLGLMVDNTIIIVEGISEYSEKYAKSIYESAILSVWNFKWAIISGTMTTVAAFLPLLLVSGIMGEFMGVIPKTIAVTLLSSLFVAIVVIPTLTTRFVKIKKSNHAGLEQHKFKKIDKLENELKIKYASLLRNILSNKKKRRKIISTILVFFIIAFLMPVFGFIRIEMFPKTDFDYFIVNLELPIGSTLDKTSEVVSEVEKIIADIPELDNYVTNIGNSVSLDMSGGSTDGLHLASLTVNLVDKKERDRKSYDIAEEMRKSLEKVQGVEIKVEELSGGPPSGAPIEIRFFGDSLKELASVVEDTSKYFESVQGVINVKDSFENAAGEFNFTIDKQKANYYGLDITTVASTLRNAIYGIKASAVNIGNEDVDITVKYDKEVFNNLNDLENILLFTPRGENIPLKQIAEVKLEPSLLNIRHRNGDRVALISADIEKGVNLQAVLKGFDEYKNTIDLPEGLSVQVGGETEDVEKSFREMFLSLIVAIILITLILVLQFNSFRQPFIIIFSLPLAVIGVIIGLLLLRMPFSITVFVGVVSLAGIVVNDAIVLIDRINKNLKDGMEFIEGIIEAGIARMKPIFLTTLTTIAGIVPLIFADELWRGLSVTVIFGLLFATVLTLVVVPIMYASMCRKSR